MQPSPERRVHRAAWGVLGAALFSQIGVSVTEQGIPTLTGFIKDDLGVSAATAGLVISSFTAGRVLGSYTAGVAADRLGERRVLVGGGIVTGAMLAIAVTLPVGGFVCFLVLAGVASAASTPAGGRLVLLAFPRRQRGFALGVRQTGIPIGGLIAAALLPWIAHLHSWRWSLAASAAITALAVIPIALAGKNRWDDDEAHHRHDVNPIRDRTIRLLTIWGCLLVGGQYSLVAFLALDLRHGAGLTLATASLLVALAQATGILGRIAWGAVSDRLLGFGRKPLLVALTAAAVFAALLLFVVPRSAPVAVLAVVAAVAGFAMIGFQGLWITMVIEAAGPARAGAATGFGITFIAASITVSPPLYGLVADIAGTYRAIWAAVAIVIAISFVPAILIHEPPDTTTR